MKTTPCNFILNTVFFESKQLLLIINNKTAQAGQRIKYNFIKYNFKNIIICK